VTITSAYIASAQVSIASPETGKSGLFNANCDAVARVAKGVLGGRGMKIVSDAHCGDELICMTTGNTRPQQANGTMLSRKEVVERYLKDPSKADFHTKKQGGGYREIPDHNFVMGGSLNLREEGEACSATLRLNFGIRYTQYLLIFPVELYGDTFQSNGLLESEYLSLIASEIAKAKK
jgi:hypothetical protein